MANLDEEIRLDSSTTEKKLYQEMAELFAIMQATERLEAAFVRDLIKAQEYNVACAKLISQFKMQMETLQQMGAMSKGIKGFMAEYNMELPKAYKRLVEDGVPATALHMTADDRSSNVLVMETVSCLITAMDTLKLNMSAVDEILPCISSLCESMNKHTTLGADFEPKLKMQSWLRTLRSMRAVDNISEDQRRQLALDIDQAYQSFESHLKQSSRR